MGNTDAPMVLKCLERVWKYRKSNSCHVGTSTFGTGLPLASFPLSCPNDLEKRRSLICRRMISSRLAIWHFTLQEAEEGGRDGLVNRERVDARTPLANGEGGRLLGPLEIN